MPKIDELIAEFCPDGVGMEKLGSLTKTVRAPRSIPRSQYLDSGILPVIDQSQLPIAGYVNELDAALDIGACVVFGDHTREVKFVDYPFAAGADGTVILSPGTAMIPRYLYFVMAALQITSRGYNRHWSAVKNIEVPVPPLEVQREIVSILDKFTQLEAELEAELEARRSQYEHTRDQLLDFSGDLSSHPLRELIAELCPEGVAHYNLDEVFDIRGGYTPSKANEVFWRDGTVPWFRMEDIRFNGRVLNDAIQKVSKEAVKKETPFEADSLIVATTATIGEHALITSPFLANQQFSILTRKTKYQSLVDPKFAFFVGFGISEHCLQNTNVSGFASVNMEAFRKFQFPIPPLEVQREIVSILDKLDALVNDLTFGLPAEIVARRKQYEYYRNKLLTFKELETA
jgi:type I restriction enzyme S subunit